MKENLKNIAILKYLVMFGRTMKVKPPMLSRLGLFIGYMGDYRTYRKLNKNNHIKISTADLFPRIHDKTKNTDVDPVYFIQGTWCARKVFENKPKGHHDIGSQALMVGIIAQFTPTTMIDIRPLSITIPNLSFTKGDINALPFADGSIQSLSSICVIEHIGLGRYGDTLDQFGTEKSASELSRVLSPGGDLYISVPIDKENKVYFNAHRAFTREYVMELFKTLKLVEESYIYGKNVLSKYDQKRGFGTGLYHFKK